jgi:hypothetical protein
MAALATLAHHMLVTGRPGVMSAHTCRCRSLRLSLCQRLRVLQMASAGCSQVAELVLASCHSLPSAGVFADKQCNAQLCMRFAVHTPRRPHGLCADAADMQGPPSSPVATSTLPVRRHHRTASIASAQASQAVLPDQPEAAAAGRLPAEAGGAGCHRMQNADVTACSQPGADRFGCQWLLPAAGAWNIVHLLHAAHYTGGVMMMLLRVCYVATR